MSSLNIFYANVKKKFFSRNDFEVLDDESNSLESDYKQSNDLSMMGSISYEFIETIDTLNSQYNYHKLEMAEDEIILLKVCNL